MHTIGRTLKYVGWALLVVIGLGLLTAISLFFATRGSYVVPATVTADSTLPSVEIDGIRFHAESYGDPADPTVVVVHGGPGGDYGYLLSLAELADRYHVVFYDQRGAGLSPRVPADELTLQSSIEDLDRIVTHFGAGEPIHLIGHSWGAMLAAAYIGQYPDRVSQVVLAEPGALDNGGLTRFNQRQAATRGVAYYRLLIPTIFESLRIDGPDADARMDYIFGKMSANFTNTAASGYGCEQSGIVKVPPDVPVPASRFGATAFTTLFGPEADLSPIAANADQYHGDVLFLASACNSFIGAEYQRTQMQLFPHAEMIVIPDAGHEMFGENPAASIAAVRAFFDQ